MLLINDTCLMTYDEVKDFGKNQENRLVNAKHVDKFVNILNTNVKSGKEAFNGSAILVNEITNNILDGQHRWTAFKRAVESGLVSNDALIRVTFISVRQDNEKGDIVARNENSLNWKLEDYIKSYAKHNDNYRKLIDFAETHELCYTISGSGKKLNYRYAAAMIKGKNCSGLLKAETFTATPEELAVADVIHKELSAIREKMELTPDTGIESMAVVWSDFRKRMDINDILNGKIPDKILRLEKKNMDNWHTIFLKLEDRAKAA